MLARSLLTNSRIITLNNLEFADVRCLNLVASLCGFGALIDDVHVHLFQQIFEEDEETLQAQLTPCKVLET